MENIFSFSSGNSGWDTISHAVHIPVIVLKIIFYIVILTGIVFFILSVFFSKRALEGLDVCLYIIYGRPAVACRLRLESFSHSPYFTLQPKNIKRKKFSIFPFHCSSVFIYSRSLSSRHLQFEYHNKWSCHSFMSYRPSYTLHCRYVFGNYNQAKRKK